MCQYGLSVELGVRTEADGAAGPLIYGVEIKYNGQSLWLLSRFRNFVRNHEKTIMIKTTLFRFSDIFKETIWGGQRLLPFKGLQADSRKIGESWELSGVSGHESVVVGGPYEGLTLTELIDECGADLLGKDTWLRCGREFPLLVKFIDAADQLSVQVHPDDELARRRHGCLGKTEMWYVVDAAPGSSMLDGFSRRITPEEYERRVADHTLSEVLNRVEVSAGDCYFLPAGRVHSIGAGCFICEIQQSCDITYRIYDFGRVDSQGRQRELHVQQAREAISFAPTTPEQAVPVVPDVPAELVRASQFTTTLYRLTEPMTCDYSELDSFVILVCLKGCCRVTSGRDSVELTAGHTLLVAAAATDVVLAPDGEAELLETYV